MLSRDVRAYIISFLIGNLNSNDRAPLHAAFKPCAYPSSLAIVSDRTPLAALQGAEEIHGVNGSVRLDSIDMPYLRLLRVDHVPARLLCTYCYTRRRKYRRKGRPNKPCDNCGNDIYSHAIGRVFYPRSAPNLEYVYVNRMYENVLPPAYPNLQRLVITSPSYDSTNVIVSDLSSLRYIAVNECGSEVQLTSLPSVEFARIKCSENVRLDNLAKLHSLEVKTDRSVRLGQLPDLKQMKVNCDKLSLLSSIPVEEAEIDCKLVACMSRMPLLRVLHLVCDYIAAQLDEIKYDSHESILCDLTELEWLDIDCKSLVRIANIRAHIARCKSHKSPVVIKTNENDLYW